MTDDLCERSFEWRAAPDGAGDGLTLEGYAAVFDQPTEINDFDGRYLESIAPGAFRKTLRERKDRVLLQYDHGHHPLIGSLPVGQIETLREDAHGLYVKARLHDNWLTEPLRDAITSGAVKGMSFRFKPIAEKNEQPTKANQLPRRTLTEVALMELGPVAWPAYQGTSVGLRAWADAAPAEFRSAFEVHDDNADGDIVDDERTPASAGTTTEDRAAAIEDEPVKATRQERRQKAALLAGVTTYDDPPGSAASAAA
jgi:HK97 family phage prohead protease